MARPGVATLAACLLLLAGARPAWAEPINVATLSCQKYQNEVLGSTEPGRQVDPINTVMWLFGWSVGKSGAHLMYGDALTAFGFALDAQCRDHPKESLQSALAAVKHSENNPMDLAALDCGAFARRHEGLKKSDPESAQTIMMWLYGFQVAKANGRVLDMARMAPFEAAFLAECGKQPPHSVYDTLSTMKF